MYGINPFHYKSYYQNYASPPQRFLPPNNYRTYNHSVSVAPAFRKVIQEYSYGLKDMIGQGLTSKVFLGRHDPSSKKVVIKVVELKAIPNEEAKQNLLSQIQILRLIQHENVVELKDVYTTANNCYIVTQYCEQGDLEQIFKSNGVFPESRALTVMIDVLQACKCLYSLKIVHRDLKSSNILLNQDGQAKLADFGFAIRYDKVSQKSQLYNVGSPLYMPPEALLKNLYSFKSDIFSLGVIFYELMFGFAPWQSRTQSELIKKVMTVPLAFPAQVSISEQSKEFLARCLEKDLELRLGPEEYEQQIGKLTTARNRIISAGAQSLEVSQYKGQPSLS